MKILKSIYNFFVELEHALVAANMARCGDYHGAQQLMMQDFKDRI